MAKHTTRRTNAQSIQSFPVLSPAQANGLRCSFPLRGRIAIAATFCRPSSAHPLLSCGLPIPTVSPSHKRTTQSRNQPSKLPATEADTIVFFRHGCRQKMRQPTHFCLFCFVLLLFCIVFGTVTVLFLFVIVFVSTRFLIAAQTPPLFF